MFKNIIAKIKQILGIGGVKLQVELPETKIAKDAGEISGTVIVRSKSDQLIQELKVEVQEQYTTGRGEDKETNEFTLGEVVIAENIEIKVDEEKTIKFTCPFTLLKSKNDLRADSDSKLTSALGKAGRFMDAEKSTYSVEVGADVKGTLTGPSASEDIELV